MGRRISWDNSKAFCKPTVIRASDQIGGTRMVHAACWAHSRRLILEAVQLNPRDVVAAPIVARMDELFAVDAEARHKGRSVAARHVWCQKRAMPLLEEIRRRIEAAQSNALPASAKQGLPARPHALEKVDTLFEVSRTGAKQ